MSIVNNRIYGIDGIRGLACISVLFLHYTYRYYEKVGIEPSGFAKLFRFGEYGVHVFFIISGFVIAMTLERKKDIGDFWASRISRLYPVYWASVLVTTLLMLILGLSWWDLRLIDVFINLTMLQSFLGVSAVDGVYWSLSWELIFYFWSSVVYYLFTAERTRDLFLVCMISLALFSAVLSSLKIEPLGYHINQLLLLRYMHLFGLGYLAFRCHSTGHTILNLLLVGVALFISALYGPAEFLFASGGYTSVILVSQGKLLFLSSKLLVHFGAISYPLYLVHQNIGHAIIQRLDAASYIVGVICAIVSSYLIAFTLHMLVERRASRVMHKWIEQSVFPWARSMFKSTRVTQTLDK